MRRDLTQRPLITAVERHRTHPATRWAASARRELALAAAIVATVAVASGCSSFSRKPLAENVVAARQLSLRGTDALQRGRSDEAESLFGKAIETCPVNDRAHAGYAEALWQKGDRDKAVSHMEHALRLSGGDPEMLVQLGEMHLARGELDAAAHRAEQAIQTQRQLAAAWVLKGDVERQRRQFAEALASYHRALAHQDHYPRAQMALADVYRQQNSPQRALATLDSLADHYTPTDVPASVRFQQGLAQKALGRYDDAAESLLAATRAGAATPDVLVQLGEAQWLAGDLSNARLTLAKALQDAPQHAAALQLAARLEGQQQRMAAATDTSKR